MVKQNKGFTLIELMIASSLLMLVMYSGYFGYSLYTSSWQKRTDLFWQQTQKGLAFNSLARMLESISPYVIESDNNQPAIYFHAQRDFAMFVTESPIFSDTKSVVMLSFETINGVLALTYREKNLANQLLLKQSDTMDWQHRVILLDNLKSGQFKYFGFDLLSKAAGYYDDPLADATNLENTKVSPEWYESHKLEVVRTLPLKLAVIIEHDEGVLSNFEIALPEHAHRKLFRYLREDA